MPQSSKPICFVAQPFQEPFQGRFDEDIEPAIEAAGMVAYKVDKDLAADKLVEDIHAGIARASVVLVDITEDNPNVWYELGYSQALDKPLVMISCSTERPAGKPYPFDVRGRKIVDYTTGKRSAHDKLRKDVTERIKALLAKEEQKLTAAPPAPVVTPTPSSAPLATPTLPNISALPNEVDAINLIREKARMSVRSGQEATVSLNGWDRDLNLPADTVSRLLEKALTHPFYVRSKGNITAVIYHDNELPF